MVTSTGDPDDRAAARVIYEQATPREGRTPPTFPVWPLSAIAAMSSSV